MMRMWDCRKDHGEASIMRGQLVEDRGGPE